MADIGASNWNATDASNTTAAPDGMPEGMAPSGVNDWGRAVMGAVKRWWNKANSTATTAGTSTAYTLTYTPASVADYDGEEHSFILHTATGAAPTLAINSRTARNLRRRIAGTWTNVAANDYPTGTPIAVRYNLADTTYDIVREAPDASYTLGVVLTTKGDQFVRTTSAVVRKAVGANGRIRMARSAETDGWADVAAFNSTIYGLTYANGSDATNDIDIAAGGCMDSTGAYWITMSAITKQLDAAWAVGTNQGGLDTGSIGNSDYYIWAIARSDTGVTDALFSLSSTSPTMPTNYDFRRLIGWFKRVGGTIVAFKTYELEGSGIELAWTAPTLDVDVSNTLTTARRTDAVKVPLNFSTIANLNVAANDASSVFTVIISCPDQTEAAPSTTGAPLANLLVNHSNGVNVAQIRVRTSATGTIASRSDLATVDGYRITTIGFEWSRR